MKFKKIASLVLASVITLSALCFPVSAQTDYTYKIQPALSEKLKKMNDNDTVDVSVWFKDIDYNVVERKVKEKLKSKVSKNVINLVDRNVNTENTLNILKEEEKKTTEELKMESEQIQLAIETKRKISSDMQIAQNKKFINDLFNKKYLMTI